MTIRHDDQSSSPPLIDQEVWAQPPHAQPAAWSATTGAIPVDVFSQPVGRPRDAPGSEALEESHPAKNSRPLVWGLAAAVVALAAVLIVVLVSSNRTNGDLRAAAAASSAASRSSSAAAAALNATFVLQGTLTMSLSDTSTFASGCSGAGGYDDIAAGTAVVVYDEANTVVATGYLGAGTPASGSCVFTFSVANVPGTAKFYQVEISHRGKVTVSAIEAKAGEYAVTLGS